MKISCPSCAAAYELDEARVSPSGLNIKCPKCKKPFTVHRPKSEAAKPGAKPAVPLPGQAGAKAPASKPAGAKPGKPGQAGAVPLPGMSDDEGAADSPPLPDLEVPGAVALPGLDGGGTLRKPPEPRAASPMRTPGASSDPIIPLPGFDDPEPPSAPPPEDPFAAVDFAAGAAPAPAAEPPPGPPPAPPDDPFSELAEAGAPPPAPAAGAESMNYDFVESKPSRPEGAADVLDFVDEGAKDGAARKRPAPPVVPKGPEAKAEDPFDFTNDASAAAAPSKQAEKDRKKKEREDRAAFEKEERARRKAIRGPGRLQTAVQSLAKPRQAVAAAVLLALVAVGILGFRARRTPAGLFWINRYLPSKRAASAAEAKVIEEGLQKLNRGDFTSAREALSAAAQLIAAVPDDEEVQAFFVLAVAEVKLEYGQMGSDWDQARRLVERLKASRPSQNRARGAFALASGDVQTAKQYLAALGDTPNADQDSTWLYAVALVAANEPLRAAPVLDTALRTRATSTRLLLLRGAIARDRGELAQAADFFERALKSAPDNARVMVELASVRLRQDDSKGASELLAKALDTDARKTLDAAEEAKANMHRGSLAIAARNPRAAEAAYERAVVLDPNSARVHEAYGQFRLQRLEWEKAARQFEQAGGSAAALAGAARAYLGQNRLLEADKAINDAVSKDPANARYLYLQGRVADAIGKAEEAYRKYEAALKAKPDLVEALCAEGMVWLSRNDNAKARDRLDAALRVPVEGLTTLEDEAIGELALGLGDRDIAREAYARALHKSPDDALAHSGMGKALAAQGNLMSARREMETALAQLDTDASLAFEYGSLLRRMGETQTAVESFRKAVKLDSKEPRYRARLGGVLVERGEFEEAEQQLRQAVALNDHNGEALYYLARALAGRKNLGEAIDLMKKAVDIDPDNAEYLYHLGLIYEHGQQIRNAIDAFSRAIDKGNRTAEAQERLGSVLMVENRFAEAVKAFTKASEMEVRRPRIWAELADAQQQAGDLEGAIRNFQRALTLDPSLPSAWTKLGIAYKDKDCHGCRTKAVDALQRATRVNPKDAVAHYELGYMFKDDGRRKEAIAEFRRYLDLRPDAGDAASVQDDIYYMQEESRRVP